MSTDETARLLDELRTRVTTLEAKVEELLQRTPPKDAAPRELGPLGNAEPARPARPAQTALSSAPAAAPRPAREPLNPIVWVGGAGALIFLTGAGFFLKWSIDEGWLGPAARFVVGIVVGLLFTGGASRALIGKTKGLGVALLLVGLGTIAFALRWGAIEYELFPAPLGLLGTFLATLGGGGLAARSRSDAALAVAVAGNLAAPLAFSQGGHHEVALCTYLAVSAASALAIPYLGHVGADWRMSRWVTVAGTWLLVGSALPDSLSSDTAALALLVGLHAALSCVWIWLPFCGAGRPSTPVLLHWFLGAATVACAWALWRDANLATARFALVVLLLGAVHAALVRPVRIRMESSGADVGLLLLATAHLALAVPIALEWEWVGPVWGLFAVGLALTARHGASSSRLGASEVLAITRTGALLAAAATVRWLVYSVEGASFCLEPPSLLPFLNTHFALGALTALAWGLLLTKRDGRGAVALAQAAAILVQVVAVVTLSRELSTLAARVLGGSTEGRVGSVVMTLSWAFAGALQWLRGIVELRAELRRMLTAAGYAWFGLASFRLLFIDLDHASVPMKALAFIGAGTIFLGSAVVGNRFGAAKPR